MTTKLDRAVYNHTGIPPIKSDDQSGHVRSREKLKTSYQYPHYYGTYGHQTSHDGNSTWGVLTYRVNSSYDQAVLQDHVTK